jgi:hypothetical protein
MGSMETSVWLLVQFRKKISRSCTDCQAWHNSELSTKERTYSGMVEMIGRLPRLGLTLVEYWNTLGLPNHVVLSHDF